MVWEDKDWDPSALPAELRDVVETQAASDSPPIHALSVEGARELVAEAYGPPDDPTPVASVNETAISGDGVDLDAAESIPVRIYRPEADPPHPAMVWFHGGGFVLGNLDVADGICRRFARAADTVVVSVGYRRAPEHPFPAALADCYAATRWTVEHADVLDVDPDRVGVGGGSAGGNLAAAVSLLARDLGDPAVAYQLVVYPMIDDDFDRESYREDPAGRASMEWYWDRYLRGPVDAANPYALPLKALDLGGLPPAEVVTVEFDALREEGAEYADRLHAAGVDVEHTHYDDRIHPFFNLDVPQADAAIAAATERFRAVVG